MITMYDLYDITAAFVAIRRDLRYDLNHEILSGIIQVLIDEKSIEDNQIRKAIANIENLDKMRWEYVYHNNFYVNHRILNDKHIYLLLIDICNSLMVLLINQQYKRAYDLIDCVHCLPDIIVENNFSIPKSFWKIYLKSYRNKWDKTFLVDYQKKIKK